MFAKLSTTTLLKTLK